MIFFFQKKIFFCAVVPQLHKILSELFFGFGAELKEKCHNKEQDAPEGKKKDI